MDGWIKLHRQIISSSKFADPDILRLWILCLTKASHKGGTALIEKQEVYLNPGQFITGRYSLQEEYNQALSPRNKVKDTTLWSWLKRLEQWGDLDINSTNKYSVVSVLKWSEYQDTLTTESQQIDNRLTTESQQTDTNKNVKKEKNVKNVKKEKELKISHAEFVSLSEPEYQKLLTEHGEEFTARCITVLDNYKGANKKKYESDYRAILNWVVSRVNEDIDKETRRAPQQSYSRERTKSGRPQMPVVSSTPVAPKTVSPEERQRMRELAKELDAS